MTDEKNIIMSFMLEIQKDIIQRSEATGQRATGETYSQFGIEANETKGILYGSAWVMTLEDGRGPSKGSGSDGSLKDKIYEWIGAKGVFNVSSEKEKRSLAYIIARKIHQEGTVLFRKGGGSGVISGAITEERINAFVGTFADYYLNRVVKSVKQNAYAK